MKVQELIELLKELNPKGHIYFGNDEELNNLFSSFILSRLSLEDEEGNIIGNEDNFVIFPNEISLLDDDERSAIGN